MNASVIIACRSREWSKGRRKTKNDVDGARWFVEVMGLNDRLQRTGPMVELRRLGQHEVAGTRVDHVKDEVKVRDEEAKEDLGRTGEGCSGERMWRWKS